MWPSSASAAFPATTANMLMSYGPVTRRSRSTTLGWPIAKPSRKAAMPAAFDKDCRANTFGRSRAAGRLRRQERPRRMVRVADEAEPRPALEPPRDRLEREAQVSRIRDLVDHHALLLRARRVVPEGPRGGQEGAAPLAVGVEDRVDRGVDAVEGLDVARRHADRRGIRLFESGVLGIGAVGIRR